MPHEERAVGAQRPDRRENARAADAASRRVAGGLLRSLGEQRRVSHVHGRNPLQDQLAGC